MTPDYTNARSADGPTVAAWISERYPVRSEMKDDPFAAIVASWNREGRLVDFYTLDEWLTPRGFFLSELPPECWRWAPSKCRHHLRPVCEQIVSEYAEGTHGRNYLARVHGIEHKTVHGWVAGIEVAA